MGTIKDIHLYLSQRLRIKEEDMRLWLYNSEVGCKAVTGASFAFIYFTFSKYQIYVSQHMTQYFLTGSYLGHISGNNFVLIENVLKMYWAYVLYEHIWHIRTVSAGES